MKDIYIISDYYNSERLLYTEDKKIADCFEDDKKCNPKIGINKFNISENKLESLKTITTVKEIQDMLVRIFDNH